jgi:hypothetical protein
MTLKAAFPDVPARHRTEFAGLKAILGGNILILPSKASVLGLFEAVHLGLFEAVH